ncbi:MAG: tRNA 2-selenouridine(34) synthase MnmH [Bacteroidales bacterium]|nr:tRNA 2-selenouridine(34) synthase MnmH [Bacteroidales bacterium]MDD4235660.1 tRNA 2-selenouridine(34) synthase MnmH [Bacteroidales bacterium]
MSDLINVTEFLEIRNSNIVIDVRTPNEYILGHIPGAYNIPLFSNEERAEVGTLYKHEGKYPAILRGLDIVGPKMSEIVRNINRLKTENQNIIVYCWRGGMRSESIMWLLNTAGIKTLRLIGGYKAYRQYGKNILSRDYKIIILGGKTGTGKTRILYKLKELGEQVIDLEKKAHHKGSAFGIIGMPVQNYNEQFENNLIEDFLQINPEKRLWLEDESKNIGRNFIPDELYLQMKKSLVLFVETELDYRINYLLEDYAKVDKEVLKDSLLRIKKRLGNNNVIDAINALESNDFNQFAEIVLRYYDKAYINSLSKKPQEMVYKLNLNTSDLYSASKVLIDKADELLD